MRYLLLLMLLPAVAHAQRVTASLVAEVSAAAPGVPFTAGVLLKIEPSWHIYSDKPGDAGMPTEVTFKLPPGWKADPVVFPVPRTFTQAGNIVTHGYEDSVLLMAQLTPPADAAGEVTLAANVAWLACKINCVPGEADVELKLPIRAAAVPANSELFDAWRKRLPPATQPSGKE